MTLLGSATKPSLLKRVESPPVVLCMNKIMTGSLDLHLAITLCPKPFSFNKPYPRSIEPCNLSPKPSQLRSGLVTQEAAIFSRERCHDTLTECSGLQGFKREDLCEDYLCFWKGRPSILFWRIPKGFLAAAIFGRDMFGSSNISKPQILQAKP